MRRNHLLFSEQQSYATGGHPDPEGVAGHLEQCAECFETHIVLLELNEDRRTAPAAPALEGILGDSARVLRLRRIKVWALAAALTIVPGTAWLYVSTFRDIAGSELVFAAAFGSCRVNGADVLSGRTPLKPDRGKTTTLTSAPFSICDLSLPGRYRLRMLENASLRLANAANLELTRGRLAVERSADVPLTIRVNSRVLSFRGTKAVLDALDSSESAITEESIVLRVAHGTVLVSGPGRASLLVKSGQALNRGGVIVPLKENQIQKLEPLFTELPVNPTAGQFRAAVQALHPTRNIVFQRVYTRDGRSVTGIVRMEHGLHIVVTQQGTLRLRAHEVERVEFLGP